MSIKNFYLILIVSIMPIFTASSFSHADAASYTYDTRSRLTRADYRSGFTEEYTYDAAGNRLTEKVTSKWLSGHGHTSSGTVSSAEISVRIRASSTEAGSFTYHNSGEGISLSSVSIGSFIIEDNTVMITGECTLNAFSGYYYTAMLTDGPDTLKIEIFNQDGTVYFSTDIEELTDGDLTIETEPFDQYALTTSLSPSGGGTLSPDCSGGCLYQYGTLVTITANSSNGYAFTEWTGCDQDANNICIMRIDSNKNTEALFTLCSGPVHLAGTPEYFSAPQDAYDMSVDSGSIELQDTLFFGNIYFDRDISVTLKGGYDCTYISNSGMTRLQGSINVSSGTVTIGNIVLE